MDDGEALFNVRRRFGRQSWHCFRFNQNRARLFTIDKVVSGDVLVVNMTTPDLELAMKRAAVSHNCHNVGKAIPVI